MITKLTKKILAGSILPIVVVGIGLHTNAIKLPIQNIIYMQYADDLSDNKILIGASHNVFTGKVIKKVGDDGGIGFPETQFEVEVIFNIKGNIKGNVIVNQEGGYQDGVLYTASIDGDTMAPSTGRIGNLLQPGTTYLFATRNTTGEGWYHLISHSNASKVITGDTSLTFIELKAIVQNDEKVQEFQEAYKSEVLLEVDVQNNYTRNSYQSLLEDGRE